MAFDFKKEYKEFYMPKNKPEIIQIPSMNFIAVRGKGNPNDTDGEYQKALGILYPVAYTLKMSYKGDYSMDGFFEYVVPPLEGFWWTPNFHGADYTSKDKFNWISIIRIPDFVKQEDVEWAKEQAAIKKGIDTSSLEFLTYDEGFCVQCMHIGPFDDEPATIALMDEYAAMQGYENDICDSRYHHEIYLNDFRKTNPAKLKTVIRHPVKKKA